MTLPKPTVGGLSGQATPSVVVDAGQSTTRVRLLAGSRAVDTTAHPLVEPLVGSREAGAAAEVLASAIKQLTDGPIDAITIGLTGFLDGPTRAGELARRLAEVFTARRVIVADDVLTGFLGALNEEPGVAVTAGTGAVALAISPSGRWAKIDGHGFLLGDHGSGFQLGLAAARAAIRTTEGGGDAQELSEAFAARFGDPTEIRRYVHSARSPQKAIAGFVPLVAEVARSGDGFAIDLWNNTAKSLAESASSALARCEHPPGAAVSYVGGLFDAHDLLLPPFREAISRLVPDAEVHAPHGDPLAGSTILHFRKDPLVLDELVHTEMTATP